MTLNFKCIISPFQAETFGDSFVLEALISDEVKSEITQAVCIYLGIGLLMYCPCYYKISVMVIYISQNKWMSSNLIKPKASAW